MLFVVVSVGTLCFLGGSAGKKEAGMGVSGFVERVRGYGEGIRVLKISSVNC